MVQMFFSCKLNLYNTINYRNMYIVTIIVSIQDIRLLVGAAGAGCFIHLDVTFRELPYFDTWRVRLDVGHAGRFSINR